VPESFHDDFHDVNENHRSAMAAKLSPFADSLAS
jgi:hypothetical protein